MCVYIYIYVYMYMYVYIYIYIYIHTYEESLEVAERMKDIQAMVTEKRVKLENAEQERNDSN